MAGELLSGYGAPQGPDIGGSKAIPGLDRGALMQALKMLGYANPVTGPSMLMAKGASMIPEEAPIRQELSALGDLLTRGDPAAAGSALSGYGQEPSPEAMPIPTGIGEPRIESLMGGGPPAGLGGALEQIQGGPSSPLPAELSGQADLRVESMMGGATELPTGAVEYPNGAIGYEIQPGDSLSLIGAMFGVTYDELIAANEELLGSQGKSTVIHPGQKIVVPSPAARGEAERAGVTDKGMTTAGDAQAYSAARRG